MFSSFGNTSATVNQNPNKHLEVQSPAQHPLNDSIQCLAWSASKGGSSGGSLLAAGCWDKTLRIWDTSTNFSGQVSANAVQVLNCEGPVLSTCFARQPMVITGTADNSVTMHNMETKTPQTIGKHEAGVSHVFFWEEKDLVISGSYDKSIKVWDGRSPNPALNIPLPEKVWAMDFKYPLMVVNGQGKNMALFDFSSGTPQNPVANMETPFRLQIRCVSLFPDRKGFGLGSIEGRCNVTNISGGGGMPMYFDQVKEKRGFAFKAHRVDDKDPKIFAVNSIDFNPTHPNLMLTAGGDGGMFIWDKGEKKKKTSFGILPNPINSARFDPTGTLIAYSSSYDWHKGYSFMDRSKATYKIFIGNVKDEVQRKPGW